MFSWIHLPNQLLPPFRFQTNLHQTAFLLIVTGSSRQYGWTRRAPRRIIHPQIASKLSIVLHSTTRVRGITDSCVLAEEKRAESPAGDLSYFHLRPDEGKEAYATTQVTAGRIGNPEDDVDSEMPAFRAEFEKRSSLDQLVRDGAQRMLRVAIIC